MADESGIYARRAELADLGPLLGLVERTGQKAQLEASFGSADPKVLISHRALMTVAVLDRKDSLVGFVAVGNAPPTTAAAPAALPEFLAEDLWGQWAEESAAAELCGVKASRCAWVAYFVADPLREEEVARLALQTVLSTLFDVDALLVHHAGALDAAGAWQAFVPVAASGSPPCVSACVRSRVFPALRVRAAVVEDHDDLLPLFQSQSGRSYGRPLGFALADLIESQTATSRAVVVEEELGAFSNNNSSGRRGTAGATTGQRRRVVGLIGLTTEVDTRLLNSGFDLEPLGVASRRALAITLLCVREEYESRAAEILGPVFDMFPECDYCLYTQPHNAEESPFLARFTFVPPRPSGTFAHVLFLLHRGSLPAAAGMTLRPLREDDLPALEALVPPSDGRERVGALARLSLVSDSDFCTLVAEGPAGEILGGAVLQPQPDSVALLSLHGAVEEVTHVPFHGPDAEDAHCELLFLVLDPLVHRHARFVVLDCLRMLGRQVMHYRALPGTPAQTVLVRDMVQVRPRRLADSQLGDPAPRDAAAPSAPSGPAGGLAASRSSSVIALAQDIAARASHVCAHFLLATHMASQPKAALHSRVVVVGASETGVEALEQLALLPGTHLDGLVLVSPDGLDPLPRELMAFLPRSPGQDGRAGRERLARLDLARRVRVIRDSVASFDADRRVLHLESGQVLPYDYLALCPGLQDQTAFDLAPRDEGFVEALDGLVSACRSARPLEALVRLLRLHHPLAGSRADQPGPAPTEEVQKASDAASAGGTVVVYGGTVGALAALRGLLASGVPPASLLWVNPLAAGQDDRWCGGDADVHSRVLRAVEEDVGIEVAHGLVLESVQHQAGAVTGVTLRLAASAEESEGGGGAAAERSAGSRRGAREEEESGASAGADRGSEAAAATSAAHAARRALPAGRLVPDQDGIKYTAGAVAVVCADEPDVSRPLFNSMQSNGLVYDGRLVVDSRFRTARPGVYAAGSVAKFSRRCGGQLHEKLQAHALGEALARSISADMQGTAPPTSGSGAGASMLTRETLEDAPRAIEAVLPGELRYFAAHSPLAKLARPDKARVLSTDRDSALTRVVLDGLGVVRAVTCLSRSAQPAGALMAPIGRPASLLGNMVERYDAGELQDLGRAFAEPWTAALADESSSELLGAAYRELAESKDCCDLRDHIGELAQRNAVDREAIASLTSHVPQSAVERIQRTTLRHVRAHQDRLPEYAPSRP